LKNFKPHKIIHLDLSATEDYNLTYTQDEGKYIVIWWKTFPLGDLFISPGHSLSESDLSAKIIKAIKPALQNYSKKSNILYALEIDTIKKTELVALCNLLFNTKESIPKRCEMSVVICTRDRADVLKNCLVDLANQYCEPAEIIVIDNASIDDSTKKIVEQFPNIKYHREDRPGLDIARNTGARVAKYPIVAYTDDDTKPHSLWTYHVYQTFDDPSIHAMTGLVIAAALNTEAQMVFEKHWPFNRGYADKIFDKKFFNDTLPSGPPVWDVGAGANMAFRKEIFNNVGYFDERLDVGASGCSGDSEMWYRILANGFSIQYNPRAVVHHLHRESMEGLHRQLFFYMRGFTSAILIQYQQFGHRGDLKHLFLTLPKYYLYLIRKGFPYYRFRHQTLLSEIRGVFSGLRFYLKHRKERAPNH
jgi:glycosyltransferase involved in cell wall biosynthesis